MELHRSPESLYVMLSIPYGHPFSANFCIETNWSCKNIIKNIVGEALITSTLLCFHVLLIARMSGVSFVMKFFSH